MSINNWWNNLSEDQKEEHRSKIRASYASMSQQEKEARSEKIKKTKSTAEAKLKASIDQKNAIQNKNEKQKRDWIEKIRNSTSETRKIKRAEIREKTRKTSEEKYRANHHFQKNYSETAKSILFDAGRLSEFMSTRSSKTAALELEVDPTTVCNWCHTHGISLDFQGKDSKLEYEFVVFLDSLKINYIKRDRIILAPKELDFVLPEYKLAFELNGLHWHCEDNKPRLYHYEKLKECSFKNIRLIMINEDEWLERREAIELKIKNLIGRSEKGVGARKLTIKQISNSEAKYFFNKHHIQKAPSILKCSFGAFFNDELVGAIAFNNQRTTKNLELIRFCSNGKIYPGMFSKIFSFAVNSTLKDVTEIISFADLRYSDGGIYKKCGFKLVEEIRPDYRWVKNRKSYHKSNFTKSNIAKKFGVDSSLKTETEWMKSFGYRKMWDCGKLKFIWYKNCATQ
jgi:hypothetical protein